jgi:hypothetical protein
MGRCGAGCGYGRRTEGHRGRFIRARQARRGGRSRADYTGKPLGEWTEDINLLMRSRPMMGAALMIGVGYAVARFLRR